MVTLDGLREVHFKNKFYTLADDNSIESRSSRELRANPSLAIETAQKLNQLASSAIKEGSNLEAPLRAAAYDYGKKYVFSKEGQTPESRAIYARGLSLLFGGNIPTKFVESMIKENHPWLKIMQSNFMHHGCLASGVQCSDKDGNLTLNIGGKNVLFDELHAKASKDGTVTYHHNRKVVFKTDKNGKFKGYYFAGISGILPGSSTKPRRKNLFKPFIKEAPVEKAELIVCTALESSSKPLCLGDHSYFGLKSKNGDVLFFGQFGTDRKVTVWNGMSHLDGGIETPDRYRTCPLFRYDTKQTRLPITDDQYEKVKDIIRRDVKDRNYKVSFLRGNCTSHVERVLEEVGFEAKTRMSAAGFLIRWSLSFIFSKETKDNIVNSLESLPGFVKKLAHFFPLMYLVTLSMGIFFWVMSRRDLLQGETPDVNILEVIFCPWKFDFDHPITLRSWQETKQEELDGGSN